jgi:hypothetical protein
MPLSKIIWNTRVKNLTVPDLKHLLVYLGFMKNTQTLQINMVPTDGKKYKVYKGRTKIKSKNKKTL